jgi:hypothetical protein
MFSDRLRLTKIVGISFTIAALGVWSRYKLQEPTWVDFLNQPGKYHGQQFVAGREAKVVSATPSRLVVTQPEGELEIRLRPDFELPPLRPGDDLVAVAVFHRDGYFELEAIEVSPWRKWKLLVSLLAAVVVIGAAVSSTRFGDGRLYLKE